MADVFNEKYQSEDNVASATSASSTSDQVAIPNQNIDTEQSAGAGGEYFVKEATSNAGDGLKVAKDGLTILIPQPSDDSEDPLNWTWLRKHKVFIALLLPSLLTDWGSSWGTTLFEAQAQTWGMSVSDASQSISGMIFLQGVGGVFTVPFVQRYGRLPVLFWSQALGTLTSLIATFMPSYASFTAFRCLQGFVTTSPPVIGLCIIHDLFFFHERARKVNIWAFMFLLGPFLAPFISSFLLSAMSWQLDFGIHSIVYGVSTVLVALLGEETLYDRKRLWKPTEGRSKISILLGIAGAKAKDQTKLWLVTKQLAEMAIKPQLLLPSIYYMILFTWAIGLVTTVTQFIRPAPYSLDNTQVSLFYLAPMTGAILGEIWGHWFNDFLCNRYIKTHNGRYQPENRLWALVPPTILAVAAMVIYGQTLQHGFPVMVLALAWGMMCFAQVSSTTAISAYALDCFPQHAALASSWINFWRTTGGFTVTYFQTKWVAKSGAGVTFGVQGAIIAAGFVFVIMTQIWGAKWRLKYPAPSTATI